MKYSKLRNDIYESISDEDKKRYIEQRYLFVLLLRKTEKNYCRNQMKKVLEATKILNSFKWYDPID